MKPLYPILMCILYTLLLLGYSGFHGGHALLHTLQIHVHPHHDHHHVGDHHHFFKFWFEIEQDAHQEEEPVTVEVFPVFVFMQAFEEIPFLNAFIWHSKYLLFVSAFFEDIRFAPPTPPPVCYSNIS